MVRFRRTFDLTGARWVGDRRPDRNLICASSGRVLLTLNVMPNNYNTKRRRPSSPHCHSAAKPIKSVKPLLSEKSLSPPRSLDNLIKWLRGQSCTINKVVEKTGPRTQSAFGLCLVLILGSGRGLFASEDIEEGELLIGINEETLINADTNSLVDHYGLEYHFFLLETRIDVGIVSGRVTLSINN